MQTNKQPNDYKNTDHNDLLTLYTEDELFDYLKRCRDDKDTVNEEKIQQVIVSKYKHIVKYLIKKFHYLHADIQEDLIQVAYVGLIQAIIRYDSHRITQSGFVSFAVPTILGEMRRYMRDKSSNVKIPRRMQEYRAQIYKFVYEYENKHGISPDINTISESLSMPYDLVIDTIVKHDHISYMNSVENTELQYKQELPDTVDNRDAKISISDILSILPARERRIMFHYFIEGYTQEKLAKINNVSQMHISRLIKEAIDKIRDKYKKEELL